MNKENKINYIKNLQHKIKNKSYLIFSTQFKEEVIQRIKKENREKLEIYKVPTKLLEKLLNISKNTFKKSLYLCVIKEDNYNLVYYINLLEQYTYYDNIGKSKILYNEYTILPEVTLNRPSNLYKTIESVIKTKLNRGFIEILESNRIINYQDTLTTEIKSVIKELKLKPKYINFTLVYAKLKEVYEHNYFKKYNAVMNLSNSLLNYVEVESINSCLNTEVVLLNNSYIENIISYFPIDLETVKKYGLKVEPKLLMEYNIDSTKDYRNVYNNPKNYLPLFYLYHLSKIKGYESLNEIYKNKENYLNCARKYFYYNEEYLINLYTHITSKVTDKLEKTEQLKNNTTDIDDLF
jgi:hypothetical protein